MDASTIKTPREMATSRSQSRAPPRPWPPPVTYDGATKKATLNPGTDLDPDTTYTATIKGGANGAKDVAGNALDQDPNTSGNQDKVWSFTTAAAGTPVEGLKGEYYDNQDLTNLKLTKTDPTINFTWGSGSPDPSIGSDTFSVSWSGQIKADQTETYTFYATTNDGARLWVNNQLIINRWSAGSATTTGTITLQAGKWYPITMEYFEGANTASAKLEYSSASTPRRVIPSSNLSPTQP